MEGKSASGEPNFGSIDDKQMEILQVAENLRAILLCNCFPVVASNSKTKNDQRQQQ